jgi:hypothetical protein
MLENFFNPDISIRPIAKLLSGAETTTYSPINTYSPQTSTTSTYSPQITETLTYSPTTTRVTYTTSTYTPFIYYSPINVFNSPSASLTKKEASLNTSNNPSTNTTQTPTLNELIKPTSNITPSQRQGVTPNLSIPFNLSSENITGIAVLIGIAALAYFILFKK